MIFKKGTKLYSIFNNKCPKCHEGSFFIEKNLFNTKKVLKLHDNCNQCNLKYLIEPSFFYGAMYVNYGITVALSVISFVVATVLFNSTMTQGFIALVIVLVLTAIPTMRLSRIIWINMFVKYDKGSSTNISIRKTKK